MGGFQLDAEGVNPDRVPKRRVYTGAQVPAIGLGTFGSDRFSAEQVAEAVRGAIACGYRHIDCASVYENQPQIGQVLREVLDSEAVKRDELWITSKLWNDSHGRVAQACRQSLDELQLDYLDLYLVHWPFPNYHPPRCDVTSRSPNARPYIHEEYMKTWRQMEALVDAGLVRHIGTSNMTIPKLKLLLRDARIKPACNEMELHPHFQQPQLFQFCIEHGILPIAYCPLGSPARPDRDRTPEDTVDLEDPVILEIARRRGITPAAVCIRWAVQRGQVPIPFSLRHYRENLEAAVGPPLTEEEMDRIRRIDKNCRLIKGQVFLWKENQSWEDLWDPSGQITPP
ncbi:MAG TPA: aldo/keto reductase [Anaerohalosphaeraceae bacterium]|nr:aldo/keto reductase [Anaerohalosphaeraceae bacterium]HPB93108.1 aldo/keto reductase [Anaerohalosphaeraceae bacterium]HRT23449.1 aldo/keto reductase [Anaerohalosphaeraceae bacterium]